MSELEATLESLKAELYRVQAQEAALREELAAKDKRQRAIDAAGGAEELKQQDSGGGDSADGKSAEELAKEVRDLERMVEMYEKENARLADALTQKDKELKTVRAEFFDKQESLVKEINKLSNKQHGSGARSDITTSFDPSKRDFASELERDALFRNMSEQIAQLEKSGRRKDETIAEMVDTLNAAEREKIVLERSLAQFRKVGASGDGRVFSEMGALIPRGIDDTETDGLDVESLRKVLVDERKKHQTEVDTLRAKLKWYAETQQLVDEAVRDRDRLKAEVDQLREQSAPANCSTLSAGTGTTQKRNLADVRRIK